MYSGVATIATTSSLCLGSLANANEADAFKSLMDSAWDKVVLYNNPDNPYLQKLAFTGRAHLDYVIIEGEGYPAAGVRESDLDYDYGGWRRLRGGFKATLFKDFTLHGECEFDPDEDPFYQRLTDAYIAWSRDKAFEIKIGKQGVGFTLDGSTSSKELLTIDRSNLTNNLWFTNEYAPGVSIGGRIDRWRYSTGIFSQGTDNGEFGNFDAGASWLASAGYDLTGITGADESLLSLDFIYNEKNPSNPPLFTNRSLGRVVSLNFRYRRDAFGFRSDLAAGEGFLGQSDLWGFVLMPYYDINGKFQMVFRYTFVESENNNGLRFARYESVPMNNTRGDQYQEGYLGLNYYIHGHKLKLQTGIQYASMRDRANDGGAFDGFAWTTGLRVAW